MSTFGARLRDARKATRLSQEALGKIVGVDQAQISNWENDEGEPKLSQGLRIARTLGLPLEWLADPEMESPPSVLSEAEQAAVDIVRAVEMKKGEAIRRLMFDPGKPRTVRDGSDAPKR